MTAIFWINLDSREDRRRFMEAQFAELGLAAERIAAVTPETLEARERGPRLSPSEACVTASHCEAWRRMVKGQLPCALILEDDAYLSSALPVFLDEARPLMSTLDLIRIETGRRRVRVAPASERLNCGVTLQRVHSGQWGTAGYLISDRCAARMLGEPRLFDMALDDIFFDPQGPAFAALDWRQCAPGLCIQGHELEAQGELWRSDVTAQRRQRRASDPGRRKVRGWRAKFAREAERLRRQGDLALAQARDFFAHGVR
ncbi:MAG: glycosyltransferase family 25 protein, partial [Vitreimonas sp.]